MDFHTFYQDVTKWMEANNLTVGKFGIESEHYWDWVIQSIGYMCNKYNNHQLVINQMNMLLSYLENSYKEVVS